MAATVVLVINSPLTISELKSKLTSTDVKSRAELLVVQENYMNALAAGFTDGTVQLTIRDTDPSVTTSGTGSVQYTV